MFPHLTAREIGVKLKAINNGIMTKEELIQGVVEEICSAEESTGDVQIAMAKPKIQTQQHVHHAKNFMINSAKGKSLMKKVSEWMIVVYCQISHFSAISRREQVNFQ